MTRRIKLARCHPSELNHYFGMCRECWEWTQNLTAPCTHTDRIKDRYGRCSSCMSRYYYLRRNKKIGDKFGTIRISKGVPTGSGPEYVARSWAKKKLDEMRIKQNEKCAICGLEDSIGLCLDHDHSCCPAGRSCEKCVREALCHGCNMRLWQLESDLVHRSLEYIKKHKEKQYE